MFLSASRSPLQPLPRSAAALRVRVSFTPPSTKRNSTSCLICVVSPSMAPAPPRGRCGLRSRGLLVTCAVASFRSPASDFRFGSPLPGLRLLGCATPGPLRGRAAARRRSIGCRTTSCVLPTYPRTPTSDFLYRFVSRWRPVPSMAPAAVNLPPSMAAGTSCPGFIRLRAHSFCAAHRLGFAATGTLGLYTTRIVAASRGELRPVFRGHLHVAIEATSTRPRV